MIKLSRQHTFVSLGLLLAAWAMPASAQYDLRPSFNYIAAHYQNFETDSGADYDGFSFEVSGQVGERWFLEGRYAEVSADNEGGNVDLDITYGRLGFIAMEQQQLSLYGGPQVLYVSYDFPFINTGSDTSFGAFVGGRYTFSRIELGGEISYANYSHGNSSYFLQYQAAARLYVTSAIALDAQLTLGDWDGFMVGASIHF